MYLPEDFCIYMRILSARRKVQTNFLNERTVISDRVPLHCPVQKTTRYKCKLLSSNIYLPEDACAYVRILSARRKVQVNFFFFVSLKKKEKKKTKLLLFIAIWYS
jgi:hypothetical protein